MYDLIGDIHGHADELLALLQRLDYHQDSGVFRHPTRRVIFLGDFIDRGPKIRQVLETVRAMVEAGSALAVMGNHEFNAVAFHTEDRKRPGEFLRPHLPKNLKQHQATLDQLSSSELVHYLEWFRSLPMWLDLPELRAVHACWTPDAHQTIIDAADHHGHMSEDFLHASLERGTTFFDAVDVTLKGRECNLPPGVNFADKDGHVRTACRTRWYLSPHGHTYQSYLLEDSLRCDLPLEPNIIAAAVPYPLTEKPVFVGHYWLSSDRPQPLAPNVACLDYSVAKGGFLTAYRWQGESQLTPDHFVWVPSLSLTNHRS